MDITVNWYERCLYIIFGVIPARFGELVSSKEHYNMYVNHEDNKIFILEKQTGRVFER